MQPTQGEGRRRFIAAMFAIFGVIASIWMGDQIHYVYGWDDTAWLFTFAITVSGTIGLLTWLVMSIVGWDKFK